MDHTENARVCNLSARELALLNGHRNLKQECSVLYHRFSCSCIPLYPEELSLVVCRQDEVTTLAANQEANADLDPWPENSMNTQECPGRGQRASTPQ